MEMIKRVFGRFYLNHPKVISVSKAVGIILLSVCVIGFGITVTFIEPLNVALIFAGIFLGGILFSLALSFIPHIFLEKWAKELPEYFISEAQKILEDKEGSQKLESLMAQVKTSKGKEGFNELKNWLKLFRDYKSLKEKLSRLRKNLPQLYEQLSEITTEIEESIEKKRQLRMELGS